MFNNEQTPFYIRQATKTSPFYINKTKPKPKQTPFYIRTNNQDITQHIVSLASHTKKENGSAWDTAAYNNE